VIEAQEHQMVRNVFRLDDRQIGSMMIPRAEIVWLDESDTLEVALKCIADSGHTRFPVCRGSLDDVRGVLNAASACCSRLARGDRPRQLGRAPGSGRVRAGDPVGHGTAGELPRCAIPTWSSSSTNTGLCRA
jgi:hypothetical protein